MTKEKSLPRSITRSSEYYGRKSARVLHLLDESVPQTFDALLVHDALREKRAHLFTLLRQTIWLLTGTLFSFSILFLRKSLLVPWDFLWHCDTEGILSVESSWKPFSLFWDGCFNFGWFFCFIIEAQFMGHCRKTDRSEQEPEKSWNRRWIESTTNQRISLYWN